MSGRSFRFSWLLSYPLVGFVYLLSFLPMPLLYVIGDLLLVVLYYGLGYRTGVVRKNLQNAFPEKTAKELKKIERDFYRHLCDIVMETVKSFSISAGSLRKRMNVLNPELLEALRQKNRSLIAVTGHFNNWEWAAMSLPMHSRYYPQGIYLAIKNPVVNRFMIRSRSRFGIDLLEVRTLFDEMQQRSDRLTISGFIADQSPSGPYKAYWMNFLNQETAVATGSEKYSRLYEMGVVFGKITKVKRGYYTLEYVLLTENTATLPEGELTKRHTALLESLIRETPANWLWSHKRWKHKRPADIPLL